MEKEISMDEILMIISDILEMCKHPQNPNKEIPPVFYTKLERLESDIQILNTFLKDTYKKENVDIDQVIKERRKNPNLSPAEKETLKLAKNIDQEFHNVEDALTNTSKLKKAQKKLKSLPKGENKRQVKERRKLFKTIGGDQTWIPL